MNEQEVKNIVVAGGGTAGWIAATALKKGLGDRVNVTLVESDDIPTVGVGEATIPPLLVLHQILGISEREFMSATNATFKLGIAFENWKDLNTKYIHSFGVAGKDCWACGFSHFWIKGMQEGLADEYGDYCLEHLAARENKFAVVANNGLNYAYHLDAGLYAKFLRGTSEECGVVRKEGKIKTVNLSKTNGFIESLTLESQENISGDFFIDCTGFRALLIGDALHTGFEDWSHWLLCDSAVAVQTESVRPPVPYTRSIAHEAGWQWQIPLQNRTGNGLVYCSRYMDDETAKNTLLKHVEGKTLNDPRIIKFKTGTRLKHWSKNCLALGLSSGFLEPLESTSIHLIQKSVIRFMQLFPGNGVKQVDIDEFNRQTKKDVDYIRDFIILHYCVTERDDSQFWRYCKNMSVPDTLKHRLSLFEETGRIFRGEDELFASESWIQVMMGQGLIPKTYHPIVDLMPRQELQQFLNRLKEITRSKLNQLPMHEEFIDKYCRSGERN
ncbi:Flavin-dependent tryptophan halogenase PrnA [Thalassocella blandensis]|nr:Flavin-dependent tryptophan halogenase PrnA [Thalassocella blandensis]